MMHRRGFLRSASLAAGAAGLNWRTALGAGESLSDMVRPLRLNANENPVGISQAAREAILNGLSRANRYPFSFVETVTEAIAARHAVEKENVVLGNGSSEVIQMIVQSLAQPGRIVVMAEPTFEVVQDYAATTPMRVRKAPLTGDYSHDLKKMRELSSNRKGALVYICNPNNPTATLTPSSQVDEWIESAPEKTWFLIDEAYFDYVDDTGYWSARKWITSKANVIVTRTFSKIFGMAGMRLGYGLARSDTAARLRTYASDVNTNALALMAAEVSLPDSNFTSQSRDLNDRSKKLLYGAFKDLNIPFIPSQTNFVMYRIEGKLEEFIERMKEREILVGRPFPPMLSHNRVSLGLPEEMEHFADTLRDFRKRGWI